MNKHDGTLQVTINIDEELQELLIAELVEHGFESFEQVEDTLRGYLPSSAWSTELESDLSAWLEDHDQTGFVETLFIPQKNWNELWEESIQPVFVSPFVIKPSWVVLPPDSETIVLEIDPKMSFGTGYHESTRLALQLLHGAIEAGDRVLDAGTGTGVLAIAAAKIGAEKVLAFDHDPWSQENAIENVERNGVGDVVAIELGTLDDMPLERFDLIVANIQLNVIRDMLPGFRQRLSDGGKLVLSGLLKKDRDAVQAMSTQHAMQIEHELLEGEWYAARLG